MAGLAFAFANRTGSPVLLTTWKGSTTRETGVGPGEVIHLPPSSVGEYIVLSERYERIGKFRLEAAMDGQRAWTEWAARSLRREGGVFELREVPA